MEAKLGLHPTREVLARFMRGDLPRKEVRRVVRHMLTDCRRCGAVTRRFWERGERSPGLQAVLEEMVAEEVESGALAHNKSGLF